MKQCYYTHECTGLKCRQGLSGMACLCLPISVPLGDNTRWLGTILWLRYCHVKTPSLSCLGNTGCTLKTLRTLYGRPTHCLFTCWPWLPMAQMLEHPKWMRSDFESHIMSLSSYSSAHPHSKEEDIDPLRCAEVSISICSDSISDGDIVWLVFENTICIFPSLLLKWIQIVIQLEGSHSNESH